MKKLYFTKTKIIHDSIQYMRVCMYLYVYMYVYMYIHSCIYHHHHICAAGTDISDPLSPLLPIVNRLRQVFRAISRILTELLYVYSTWSSRFCSAIWGGPLEYITYELIPASPAVSCMSGSSNLDSFRDGW